MMSVSFKGNLLVVSVKTQPGCSRRKLTRPWNWVLLVKGRLESMVYREEIAARGVFQYKQGRQKVKDKVKGGIGMMWRAGNHHQLFHQA